MIWIVRKDKGEGSPLKKSRDRKNLELARKIQNGEIDGEELEHEYAIAKLRQMFNRGKLGKKESHILHIFDFNPLVYEVVKKDMWMHDYLIETIEEAKKDRIKENRKELLARCHISRNGPAIAGTAKALPRTADRYSLLYRED